MTCGTSTPPPPPTLVDWLTWLSVDGKSDKTIYDYGRGIAPLLRAHPDKQVGEFSGDDINAQLALIPPRSRYINRSIYNGFFTWLYKRRRIDESPMRDVAEPREPRRAAPEIFTDPERQLLEGLPLPDGQLWTILFGTGARMGDARQLQRKSIDLGRARVTFYNGKGGKDGVVPVMPEVVAAVADLDLYERLRPDDYLWYRSRYPVGNVHRRGVGEGPISLTAFKNWYARGVEAAGVRYLSPHKTRHTYGHWLKRLGVFDLEERAMLMRHNDTRTTKKYYPTVSIEDLADRFAELALTNRPQRASSLATAPLARGRGLRDG